MNTEKEKGQAQERKNRKEAEPRERWSTGMKGLRKGHREEGSETHVTVPFQQRLENSDKWTIRGGVLHG